jgi:hypothetical protein
MIWLLPRYGLLGGAWLAATLMILNRGVIACMLLAKELKVNPFTYAAGIYPLPMTIGALTLAFLYWVRAAFLPGRTWTELMAAGVVMTVPYMTAALLFCVSPGHRATLVDRLRHSFGSRWRTA